MDVGTFRAWLSGMDNLTVGQREEVQEILYGQEPGAEVTSAIEDRLTIQQLTYGLWVVVLHLHSVSSRSPTIEEILRHSGAVADASFDLIDVDLPFCHGAGLITALHAFTDDADLPVAERAVVIEIVELEAGPLCIALDDLCT